MASSTAAGSVRMETNCHIRRTAQLTPTTDIAIYILWAIHS